MMRIAMTYMLMLLIALQSMVAVADVHQSHQASAEHLSFQADRNTEYGTDSALQLSLLDDPVEKSTNNQFDCQHCCHCHGAAHFFLGSHSNTLAVIPSKQILPEFKLAYLSQPLSPDNPPPIF